MYFIICILKFQKKKSSNPFIVRLFYIDLNFSTKKVNGFDELYFMYINGVNLCRRIGKLSKFVYYPKVETVHNYEKAAYNNNNKLLTYHINLP
jgi:GT2 family glycosyltransferase